MKLKKCTLNSQHSVEFNILNLTSQLEGLFNIYVFLMVILFI